MLKTIGFAVLWLVGSVAAVAVAWTGVSIVDDGLIDPAPANDRVAALAQAGTAAKIAEATQIAQTAESLAANGSTTEAAESTSTSGDEAAAVVARPPEPDLATDVVPADDARRADTDRAAGSGSADTGGDRSGDRDPARGTDAGDTGNDDNGDDSTEPAPATPTMTPSAVPSSEAPTPTAEPTATPLPAAFATATPTPTFPPATSTPVPPEPTSTPVPPTPAPPPPTATSVPATPTPPPVATQTLTFHLIGGSAAISFSPSGADVVWASPNPGFHVQIEPRSHGVEVEFEADHHESKLEAWWGGGPQHKVREEPE